MAESNRVIALIPARIGSKGIYKKNIKLLAGKPLIAYSIEAAKNSGIFDKIFVTTDSDEIIDVAKKAGADVPFIRPKELSDDSAKAKDVYTHALKWIKENYSNSCEYFMVLLPTNPLRNASDIKNAFNIILDKKCNAVISVCETEYPPFWSNTLDKDLKMDDFLSEEARTKNRQELPAFYRLNGAIYLSRIEYFIKFSDWYHSNCYAYVMPQLRSVDIDTEFDFKLCEFILKSYE